MFIYKFIVLLLFSHILKIPELSSQGIIAFFSASFKKILRFVYLYFGLNSQDTSLAVSERENSGHTSVPFVTLSLFHHTM